jgi:hypothetical protein
MNSLIAAYAFVAVIVAVFVGALGMLLLTAHEIRTITKHGIAKH